jgi:hypothetical protein
VFLNLRDVPTRAATGAYILHTGLEKWKEGEERAKDVHGMASGVALLAPVVSNKVAGACLTAFAGGLLGMYMRTPALHKPGSVWPTQAGTGVSKDVWMLGIGLGLLVDGIAESREA